MKKLSSLLLIAILCSTLYSCQNTTPPLTEPDDTTDTAKVADTSTDDTTSEDNSIKSIEEQQGEIKAAMDRAINTEVVYKEIEEYNPDTPEYDHIKAITYDGFDYQGQKTKVFAYIGFPEGASAENPVPAIVLVHGGGGHPYLEWVEKWNKSGYAAIAMETTGYFPIARNDGVDEYQNNRFVYELHGVFKEEGYTLAPDRFYSTEYMEVEDQWAYHGLTQVILAHNILRQDERVDTDNIGITGISWGGVMTSQIIGYDNRFAFAIPVYGTAYLGDETRPFRSFDNEYVDALWAAERNLDNAKMPIFWYAYNDDGNFGVPAYVKSYQHTEGFNEKNVLYMRANWGHSHKSVYTNNNQSLIFADWVVFDKGGYVTFDTQPEGREIDCTINVPQGIKRVISAHLYYITEPMEYPITDKGTDNEYAKLTASWILDTECLTVDSETGKITGTVPEDAYGYYIQVNFSLGSSSSASTSVFVTAE